jgi:hypothetical protein
MRATRNSADLARAGRPGELRPPAGSRAERRSEPWRKPFRRVQSELRTTTARLEKARRTIEAGERFLANCRVENRQHWRDLRPLPNLHRCLINATNRLIRGQRAITHTIARIIEFPQRSNAASAALFEAQTELFARLRETGLPIVRLEDLLAATRSSSGPLARFSLLAPDPETDSDTAIIRRGSDAEPALPDYPPYRHPLGDTASAAGGSPGGALRPLSPSARSDHEIQRWKAPPERGQRRKRWLRKTWKRWIRTRIPTTTRSRASRVRGRWMERIEAWRQEVPDFDLPLPAGNRRKLAAARLVPNDFVEQMCAAMEGDELLTRGGIGADQLRDLILYALAYGPVADEMERLAKEMRHSVDTAKVKAGAEALITFKVAERLAALPGNEHLVPMVETMRRTLRTAPRFRPTRKAKKEGTETPSQPAAQPAPVNHPTTN